MASPLSGFGKPTPGFTKLRLPAPTTRYLGFAKLFWKAYTAIAQKLRQFAEPSRSPLSSLGLPN